MASPFLYFPGDALSLAELTAARLDGHTVDLGDAFIPADAVETPALRAGSLAALLGDVLAATHLSAAWVHGGLHDPPARHTVQRAVPRRLHRTFGRRLVYRDLFVEPDDLWLLGGVWVTHPVRTLADLVRTGDDENVRAARMLVRAHPDLIEPARAHLRERRSLPNKKAAIALLEGWAAVGGEVLRRM